MHQANIFLPFLGTQLLTMAVWIYMYARRLPFLVRTGMIKQAYISRATLASASPPEVSNPSDNLTNLLELPVIFYAVVLYLYVMRQVDVPYLAAAWVFFVFRVLHSIVHCTFNRVSLRFLLHVISALALWYMVVRAAITALG